MANLRTPSASGVAILIHSRHMKRIIRKQYESDRIMAVDLRMDNRIFRIIAVYLPHAGYPWTDFENCMEALTALVMEASNQKKYKI